MPLAYVIMNEGTGLLLVFFLLGGLFFATVHVDVRACVDAHSVVHESRGVYVCSTLLARTYHHTRV